MAHLHAGDVPKPVIKTPEEIYEQIQGICDKVIQRLNSLDDAALKLESPDSIQHCIQRDLVALREILTALFISVRLLHYSQT